MTLLLALCLLLSRPVARLAALPRLALVAPTLVLALVLLLTLAVPSLL
jgi:hypothetical protein